MINAAKIFENHEDFNTALSYYLMAAKKDNMEGFY